MVLNSRIITRIAAPTMKDIVDINIESLANAFIVFAPATASTVLIKPTDMPAISSHLRRTDGDAFGIKFMLGTNKNRQAISTRAKLTSDSIKPEISTSRRARIFE